MSTVIDPARMTWRARFYLTAAASRHGAFGAVALATDYDFANVDAGFSITMWGLIFVAGASHLLYAGIRGSEMHARIALAVSAVITSVWAAAFWVMAVDPTSDLRGVLLAITLTAVVWKDLTVVGDPMRSPFESIVREYVKEGDDAHAAASRESRRRLRARWHRR